MSNSREQSVAEAFVRLANSLVGEFDMIELLSGLTSDCAELLDIASAGLLLADERGVLHVVAASSEATRLLEIYQLQRDEGPCRDCYVSGTPVSVVDLDEYRDRWPHFVEAATSAGFASVHAVPMRLRDKVLGSVGLFGTSSGELDDDDLALAQALAHVASIALVQGLAATQPVNVGAQLSATLHNRASLEQAKGLLSYVGDVDMDEAFSAMLEYARKNGMALGMVAEGLVYKTLDAGVVLAETQHRHST